MNMSKQAKRLKLFYSYAYEDAVLFNELEKHLNILTRRGLIVPWHSRLVTAGTNWSDVVDQQIENADVILLLISSDFLSSDYAYNREMQRALKKHERGEARVIPIILRPADWESSPFGLLQPLPRGGIAITKWRDRDEAFADVVKGIERVCQEILQNKLELEKKFSQQDEQVSGSRELRGPLLPWSPPSISGTALNFYRLSDVFVKSGLPEVTFVEREDFVFLKLALEQRGRGVVIEGPSGVGKTTAVEKAVEDLKKSRLKSYLPIQQKLNARNPQDRDTLQNLRE